MKWSPYIHVMGLVQNQVTPAGRTGRGWSWDGYRFWKDDHSFLGQFRTAKLRIHLLITFDNFQVIRVVGT